MFEIIMLLAFLGAATSQLVPSDASHGKLTEWLKKRLVQRGPVHDKALQKRQRQTAARRADKGRNNILTCLV